MWRKQKKGIGGYIDFYNNERPHQSLDGKKPREVFFGSYQPKNEAVIGASRGRQASPSFLGALGLPAANVYKCKEQPKE